jgi:hypothetical protein
MSRKRCRDWGQNRERSGSETPVTFDVDCLSLSLFREDKLFCLWSGEFSPLPQLLFLCSNMIRWEKLWPSFRTSQVLSCSPGKTFNASLLTLTVLAADKFKVTCWNKILTFLYDRDNRLRIGCIEISLSRGNRQLKLIKFSNHAQ